MKLEIKKLYHAHLFGAKKVMENKNHLNKINVFPVADGDTGSNLFSMMNVILHESELKETFKQTFESISDAALAGARGNSGIIFAQYLNGMSMELTSDMTFTLKNYVDANQRAVEYAYDAIENPVEGTMLTAMKAWANALAEFIDKTPNLRDVLTLAKAKLDEAVKNTQYQLADLQKANVVDSGAKGFFFFISGIIEFLLSEKESIDIDEIADDEVIKFEIPQHKHGGILEYRYCTEALFEGEECNLVAIREDLAKLGNSLVAAGNKRKTRIHIHTNDPATVFEIIQKKARTLYQKVDDMKLQIDMVENQKNKIAILTDSIADLPLSFIDEHQIHVINLSILFDDINYIDKLTIRPAKLMEYSKGKSLPTTSQPDPKVVENKYNYLLTYYEKIIVITVSKELSGTYNTFMNAAKKFKSDAIKIIDSKQNSGAEGLVVMECAKLLDQGASFEEAIEGTYKNIEKSKILVCVKTLENMIRSGRLSVKAGKIANFVGMKPIVTLDEEGKGGLGGFAFSFKGSQRKAIQHMKKITKTQSIRSYSVVHINNEEEAVLFAAKVEAEIGVPPTYIMETSSIIAIGAGEGGVAIAYVLN